MNINEAKEILKNIGLFLTRKKLLRENSENPQMYDKAYEIGYNKVDDDSKRLNDSELSADGIECEFINRYPVSEDIQDRSYSIDIRNDIAFRVPVSPDEIATQGRAKVVGMIRNRISKVLAALKPELNFEWTYDSCDNGAGDTLILTYTTLQTIKLPL